MAFARIGVAGPTEVVGTWEGFDVGRDSLSPVSLRYEDKGEFAFTGKLQKVVLEIK